MNKFRSAASTLYAILNLGSGVLCYALAQLALLPTRFCKTRKAVLVHWLYDEAVPVLATCGKWSRPLPAVNRWADRVIPAPQGNVGLFESMVAESTANFMAKTIRSVQ